MKNKNHKNLSKHLKAFDKAVISWKAPEYTYHQKSPLWFLIAGLIVLALVVYGLVTDGWTFSVAMIVFAGTYYLFYKSEPPVVDVKISTFGIKIGHHVFPYSNLRNFWIVYDPPSVKRLYLRMASKFQPDVFVDLKDTDPSELRKFLKQYLKELPSQHEPFSDTLVRLFKL
jgi:hypothetical protein